MLLARPDTPPAIEPAKATAIPVTAVVLTLNEAENIRACLAGLARVQDIVILDSGSNDGTVETARSERPGIRVLEHPFRDFGEQRNYAIDHCGAGVEWILFVDADEHCTDAFLDEVARFIADPGDKVGAYVAGKNYFLGRWLKYSTLYPSYQLRLLKRGHVRFRKEGHGQLELSDGPLHYLVEGWRHEPFQRGVHHYMDAAQLVHDGRGRVAAARPRASRCSSHPCSRETWWRDGAPSSIWPRACRAGRYSTFSICIWCAADSATAIRA